ncbi:PREDICTED: dentin sialophosphoprotein-like [Dufourea novaeangliae]|uniref:dentin sialophosphoprotein-like n=1 Tax=Dufourea novaeangliae TaxID=178035 RepID=UPI0007676A7A|nr:PREDICTED: dentin sialophosphoprotein-like [Dufourea novaeangliae]
MPKENKSTSRRSRRQCHEVDKDIPVPGERGSVKTVTRGNRYNPLSRESPKSDTRLEKQIATVTSTEVLHPTSGGIIGNGIKYIMFPLHLLRFCIFGTSSESKESEKNKGAEEPRSSYKKEVKDKKEEKLKDQETRRTKDKKSSNDKSSEESRKISKSNSHSETKNTSPREKDSKKDSKRDNEESTDELVTAAEDSDSSTDQWSTARTTMIMNMSMDNDNIDRSMSFAALEEPMDISMEEHIYEKSHIGTKTSRDNRALGNVLDTTESASSRSHVDKQETNSSVDEEIARIFQKQCTSSDDENPSSYSQSLFRKRDKTKESDSLYHEKHNSYTSAVTRSKRLPQEIERERKKKTPSDAVVHQKRRKLSQDEDTNEKQSDRKTETKSRIEKRSSRQDTPSKSRTRSSRTPVKVKESKRRDVKYKETATQTDSAFSDDDVEMIPIDMNSTEKQFCCKSYCFFSFKGKEMERELNYTADNEDSHDGFTRIAHKQISSGSTSSISTDLGFDERVFITPETDIGMGRLHTNTYDTMIASRMCNRAPPGFPEIPQNPPITSYARINWKQCTVTAPLINNCYPSSVITGAIVPPAPSPMRHLYYDYPEFMDLPSNVNSSKILSNILRNNYYR